MKYANSIHSSTSGQAAARRHDRFSTLLALIIVFSLVALAAYPAAAQTETTPAAPELSWTIRTVDDPPNLIGLTDRTTRFDGSGNPHIAFGGDHLYYARWNPSNSSWYIITVDSSLNVGSYASLAVDSLGNPRIAYYDETNGALRFAYSQNGGYNWTLLPPVDTFGPQPAVAYDPENPTIEQMLQPYLKKPASVLDNLPGKNLSQLAPVQDETGAGGYTSIATDSLNRVHISYYDWTNGLLKYARWDGVNWTIQTVDGDPETDLNVGKYSSIAVDQYNLAHISYMDEKYDGLKYAVDNGNSWSSDEIDSRQAPNYRYGGYSSLVLNSNGTPFISYQDWQNLDLWFATPVSSGGNCGPEASWLCVKVDGGNYTGFYTSIGLSGSTLLISYGEQDTGALRLAQSYDNGKKWSTETRDDGNGAGWYTSLAVDPDGYAGISYYSNENGLFSFIQDSEDGWYTTGLVSAADLLPAPSLAISSINVPNVGYFNDTGDQIKLATGYGWSKQVASTQGSSLLSVQLTQSGSPVVAYYDPIANNLVYAYLSGGVWYYSTVDDTYGSGMYPSLALDSADRPYISYYDGVNGALKFAYWNGTAWLIQDVELSSADVGQYNSLVLSKNSGNCYALLPTGICPMISYYDFTNQHLKFAFLSVIGAWATQVADGNTLGNDNADNPLPHSNSIALDYSGNLHISYYDQANGYLRQVVGTRDASAWIWSASQVVDTGNVGQYNSIAINAANTVYVSYYDVTNSRLKLATQTSGIWSLEVVDGAPGAGAGTSVALFTNGQPGIAYFDSSSEAVRFATQYTGIYGKPLFVPLIRK